MLVDPKTDILISVNFNYSARISGIRYGEDRNDIKGAIFILYEISDRDTHSRHVPEAALKGRRALW